MLLENTKMEELGKRQKGEKVKVVEEGAPLRLDWVSRELVDAKKEEKKKEKLGEKYIAPQVHPTAKESKIANLALSKIKKQGND